MKLQNKSKGDKNKMGNIRGYKAFDKGLRCRGFQYEIGKTYKFNGKIKLCISGFHFCKKAVDCSFYYDIPSSEYAEVEATGKVIEGYDKCVTDEIKIVRLISRSEFYELINGGMNNVGTRNSGDKNIGDWNTGDFNMGSCNSGDRNTGNRNVGHKNIGDGNTGSGNTGKYNTGDWNIVDWSTGCFCTEPQTVKFFDIDTGKTYQELLEALPKILWYIPYGHYWESGELKEYTIEDRQNFYDRLNDENKKRIKKIPNFDAYKFEQCTGIKV